MVLSIKKAALAALSFFTLGNAAPTTQVEVKRHSSGYKNVVYFTNWGIYGRNYQPAQLPANQITHVLYSFANLRSNGEVFLSDTYADLEKHYPGDSWNDVGNNVYGCIKQLFLLKKQHRHLKTLLSIGGWTYSPTFPAAASTAAGRALFASSAVRLLADLGFDGIDIDWEYPANPTESANFILLLKAVRSALDAYAAAHAPAGTHFLLTIAAPAGPANYNKMPLSEMHPLLDFINLMAYDFSGPWDLSAAAHQANLHPSNNTATTPFSTVAAVDAYLAAGVPSQKLILGMPIYGRSFANTDGLGKPFTGPGGGSWEQGVYDYKVLPQPNSVVQYDAVAGATYSYNAAKKEFVSFDTVEMIDRKVDYLLGEGLGGSMFWEASGDRPVGSGSLIETSANGLGQLESAQNVLSFPDSKYDNLRGGFA